MLISSMVTANQEIIDIKSLEGKSLEELRIMHNEIYARYGKPFKSPELHCYFMSQNWYKLDIKYDDSKLTPVDRKNIEIILKKENEMLKHNYVTANNKKRINWDNIINKSQFGKFDPEDIDKICQNGFIVIPADYEQFFFLYEENNYKFIPSFITTDSVLQLYHMFFDFTLRNLEGKKLFEIITKLTGAMLNLSEDLYKSTTNEKIKDAALKNMIYFSVPHYFLTEGKASINKQIYSIVKKEIDKCEAHLDREISLIFNRKDHKIDYSQFVPRGHYTTSKNLKSYFKAMMWHGINYFISNREEELIPSLIITKQLYENKIQGERLIDLWEKIYGPTAFYVGLSDDLGPDDYKPIMDKVFGVNADFNSFTDKAKLKKFKKAVMEIAEKKTKIRVKLIHISDEPQFRFMGQRYIPDSEILQRLCSWPERPIPMGLDVMAVIGSKQARQLLLEKDKIQDEWEEYPERLDEVTADFNKLTPSDWKKNLYYSWIWCLKSLIELNKKEYKYPFFMQNEAWDKKNLNTSLASWAELRHDTILYAKQSGVECGDGEEWSPDPPKGYVEPNIEFYKRLKGLLIFTNEGLRERNLLTEEMNEKFKNFIELVSFLEKIAKKELTNEPITFQEYKQIEIYGTLLENLTISVMVEDKHLRWFEIISDVDKDVAVIADVHTSQETVLEEAVGHVFEIYVVIEKEGKLWLTRGGVFSYYEFLHPASDRLTDEKWQKMIKDKEIPDVPDWTKDYMGKEPKHILPIPRYIYHSGC